MIVIELILLTIAYTLLIIALFLQVICFKRGIESKETIAFTVSLLLLIIAISTSPLLDESYDQALSSIFTLLAMVLVSATTFLNISNERLHRIHPIVNRVHIGVAFLLFVAAIATYFSEHLRYVQYAIIAFLILSVVASMLLVVMTKPLERYAHLEKIDRISAMAFMTLIPLYLLFHFGFQEQYAKLQIGFILPIAFILLAGNKIFDDLKRLSMVKTGIEPQKQQFKNYGLTEREEEIALLLTKGNTYRSISEQLYISLPTVKTHASNIYKKCAVKTRHELTARLFN